ncbi:MAG: DNA adenine methylase [Anaerovoracaceae bacterium]
MAKPFVKWAGGKGQLLGKIADEYPMGKGKAITKYCEPFVGGGAVLFDVLQNYNFEEILINDINIELINVYIQIRDNSEQIIEDLNKVEKEFLKFSMEKRVERFYENRKKYNMLISTKKKDEELQKAVLFLFLNKTCFNGLYRVNSKGEYNVPSGKYKNPTICDSENISEVSKLLRGVDIVTGDYSQCRYFIDNKSFVYIDPPYRPISKTEAFTAYSASGFNDIEQLRLGEFVDEITEAGAQIILSNSDPKNTDESDNFFDKIYEKYRISRVEASRMINCNGKARGKINELIICNY